MRRRRNGPRNDTTSRSGWAYESTRAVLGAARVGGPPCSRPRPGGARRSSPRRAHRLAHQWMAQPTAMMAAPISASRSRSSPILARRDSVEGRSPAVVEPVVAEASDRRRTGGRWRPSLPGPALPAGPTALRPRPAWRSGSQDDRGGSPDRGTRGDQTMGGARGSPGLRGVVPARVHAAVPPRAAGGLRWAFVAPPSARARCLRRPPMKPGLPPLCLPRHYCAVEAPAPG